MYYLKLACFFKSYSFDKMIVLGLSQSGLLPLYPFILSLGQFIAIDPFEGARWLNSILFGLNIILICFVIKKYTRSFGMGLAGALLMLLAWDVEKVHLMAQNESLFIFIMLLWFLVFFNYLTSFKISWLVTGACW